MGKSDAIWFLKTWCLLHSPCRLILLPYRFGYLHGQLYSNKNTATVQVSTGTLTRLDDATCASVSRTDFFLFRTVRYNIYFLLHDAEICYITSNDLPTMHSPIAHSYSVLDSFTMYWVIFVMYAGRLCMRPSQNRHYQVHIPALLPSPFSFHRLFLWPRIRATLVTASGAATSIFDCSLITLKHVLHCSYVRRGRSQF